MKFKLSKIIRKLFFGFKKNKSTPSFNSKNYWNNRYLNNDNSGAGSYGILAAFKAEIINDFVSTHDITSIIELGCGDGNQLKLANYKNYVGFDVSSEAIKICSRTFEGDNTKKFLDYSEIEITEYSAELVLSLDVIFHLIEDDVYKKYMNNLFRLSSRYVIIYSCNHSEEIVSHVKCRKFTDWINSEIQDEFKLLKFIPNKYPYDPNNPNTTSFSDFYIYERVKI